MSTTITTTTAQPITAEAMLRLFPDIDTTSEALTGHDEEQIRLMDEVCIVTDENDMPIGTASKKICAKPLLPPGMSNVGIAIAILSANTIFLKNIRPPDDQHRQGTLAPCLFRLPFQRQERATASAARL